MQSPPNDKSFPRAHTFCVWDKVHAITINSTSAKISPSLQKHFYRLSPNRMAYCGPTHYKPVAEWVPASGGSVPPNAIEVGYDGGNVIYVARAHHQGDNIPGKLVPAHGSCYVAWGGEEHGYHQYEVLVAPYGATLEWRYANGSDLPPGAVQGGSTADGEPLYIGRANHEGAMCSGKVQPTHGVLYVAYGGGEHPHNSYEVLVCRSVNF